MNYRLILAGLLLGSSSLTAGCANHLVVSGFDNGDCAAGACESTQTSIAGRSGFNTNAASGRVVADKCGLQPLTRVEVDRNFGQGLLTVVTLGIVNSATLKFKCAPAPVNPYISCQSVDVEPDEDFKTYITCTKPETKDSPAIKYDCVATGTAANPEKAVSFTCNDEKVSALADAEEGRG